MSDKLTLGLESSAVTNHSVADQSETGELNAAIYARTSSASQEFGYSIEEQVRRCWKRCQRLNWQVTHVFRDEAVSGKDTDRPEFQKLIDRVETGSLDVVVFWKLDRFSRSLIHAVRLEEEFREYGVALHSITEQIDTTTPAGRFNFRNLSNASEFERELIKQRSKMGMKALALEHRWPNDNPPLGYKKTDEGKLDVVSAQAELVRDIFKRYIDMRSMPEVAMWLTEQELPTDINTEWDSRRVGDVLRNELYVGMYTVAGVEEFVPEYRIIDEGVFDEVTSVRMRFQRSDSVERDEMSESRKKELVESVIEQYEEYIQGDDG
jgi:site-specific DNA recombinase